MNAAMRTRTVGSYTTRSRAHNWRNSEAMVDLFTVENTNMAQHASWNFTLLVGGHA